MVESYEMRAKYARLNQPESERPSVDEAYRSSSESDIDELDPLNNEDNDGAKLKRNQSRKTSILESAPFLPFGNGEKLPSQRRRWYQPNRTCCAILIFFLVAIIMLLSAGGVWIWKTVPKTGQSPPWYPSPSGGTDGNWTESYKKAAELVRQMTLVEKVNITTGVGWMMGMCVGNSGPVPRLGFPSLCLQDGPLGIRFADNITAFPAGITVGATWNKELMYERGKAHGMEARLKGVNVLLGPAMGPLGRLPAGGRNWEGFGADPVLQGIAAAQTIRGIQDEGVIATAKHLIANEQEHFRQSLEFGTPNAISSNVDDRTLHELYLWPFAESVRAGVGSIMCSYNQVNNSYACGNSKLLNGLLKDELGFQGFVQSDWLAQRSGVASALAGLDQSMPGDGLRWQDGRSLWGPELTKAVLNGSVPTERVDDMVTRVVAAWYQMGQDEKEKFSGPNFSSWTDDEVGLLRPGSDDKTTGIVNKFINPQKEKGHPHGEIVRKVAAEGIVLLKNEDDTLPLDHKYHKNARSQKRQKKLKIGIFGEDSRENPDGINSCRDRGCNVGTLASGWGSGAVDFPYLVSPIAALREAFDENSVELTHWPEQKIPSDKTHLVEDQEICIVFANADAGEGYIRSGGISGDRNDLLLQNGGDDLVFTVGKRCGKGYGKTIVVLHTVGPVIVEKWVDLKAVMAVLYANLPGQESGNALVDVLFGDVNPSGRLPYTIGKSEEDYGADSKILYFPNGPVPQQDFTEGLYIDYRHFDKYNITPRYEFGYGLSYTKFKLSLLDIDFRYENHTLLPKPRPDVASQPPKYDSKVPKAEMALFPTAFRKLKKYIYPYIESVDEIKNGRYPYPDGYDTPATPSAAGGAQGGNPDLYTVITNVRTTITNEGFRDGAVVVQLYVSYPPDYRDEETGEPVDFPVRVLRGFEKTRLGKNGGEKVLSFALTRKDLSYWCVRRQNWVLPTTGQFTISVGFSSRDLPLVGKF